MVFEEKMCVVLIIWSCKPTGLHLDLRTKIAAASAWLPLLYDTVILALTTYKAFQNRPLPGYFYSPILQTVLAGGIVYYG